MLRALTLLLRRLVDGRYHWGYVVRGSTRYGVDWVRITIYPPEISPIERRCAHLYRRWLWVTILTLLLTLDAIAVIAGIPHATVAVGISAALILGLVMVARLSSSVRRRSVQVHARRSVGDDPDDTDGYARAQHLADDLVALEHRYERGEITWPQYRLHWGFQHAYHRS